MFVGIYILWCIEVCYKIIRFLFVVRVLRNKGRFFVLELSRLNKKVCCLLLFLGFKVWFYIFYDGF